MMQRNLTIGLFVTLILSLIIGLMPVHGEEEIYDTVVRLHILANSDSEEDQALKLRVRDAVLEVTTPLLRDCTDRADAVTRLNEHLEEIRATAEGVVRDAGRNDAVTISFDLEEYPERTYDSFCFPSGEYLSLRICIGEAEGQNWWCCLVPPLCKGAASVSRKEAENAFVSVGLTPSQYKIITEKDETVYKVRFKILELFQRG